MRPLDEILRNPNRYRKLPIDFDQDLEDYDIDPDEDDELEDEYEDEYDGGYDDDEEDSY